jgi:hypothetical protein
MWLKYLDSPILSNTHTALIIAILVSLEAECLDCSLKSQRQLFFLEQKVTLESVKFGAKFSTAISDRHHHLLGSGSTLPLR